ncbi:MAG: hypothetical protein MR853_07210 [Selenomonadales bacterium]|nr:hypothetical protein [Selenomonadales bacterium]
MPKYYSPNGNIEVWEQKPEGYYTVEEWQELHPAPTPPEPSKDEKLAELDSQYERDKVQLCNYYTEAVMRDDAELQEEVKSELNALDAQYDLDINTIE